MPKLKTYRVFFPLTGTVSVEVTAINAAKAKEKAENEYAGSPMSRHDLDDDPAFGDAATDVVEVR